MINPSTINLLTLPSLPLEKRCYLPATTCIYFVMDSEGNVLYIGMTKNLWQRWTNHHTLIKLKKISGIRLVWLEVNDNSLSPSIEFALIDWFNPLLNKTSVSPVNKKGIRIRQVKEIESDGLGERIKEARLNSRKSLEQICDEVGVSRTYWYDLEKETLRGALSIENLRKIEQALGIDLGIKFDDN